MGGEVGVYSREGGQRFLKFRGTYLNGALIQCGGERLIQGSRVIFLFVLLLLPFLKSVLM